MDKSEIRINKSNGDNLKGLKNNGLIEIECADCGTKLLQLQLTTINGKQAQVLTRVTVKCGLCGGFSYVKQVPGQFYPGVPSDNMAFDIEHNHVDAPETDILFKVWRK